MAVQFHSGKHIHVIIHASPAATHRSLLIQHNGLSVPSKHWPLLSHLPMLSPPIATTLLSVRLLESDCTDLVCIESDSSFLWLAYFIQQNVFNIYPCCNLCLDFLPVRDWVVSHRVSVSYFGSRSTLSFFYSFETESYSVTSSGWLQTH